MDFARILFSEISFEPELSQTNGQTNGHSNSTILCEHKLCDPNLVQLDWLQSERIGGGLINVGNTCFLNSVLQCLTYCPPLYNFLIKRDGGHSSSCKINTFCMLCEMEKHVKRIKSSTGSAIKPLSIVQRLKYINKSFQFGRQEDAHEFLRYIIDHMWKACLMNLDINTKTNKIDPRIKETTTINHIFGGYHRSQVLCLSCNSRSDTFDFFMDFILDIRNAKSLEDALKKFTQPETLENENAYKCSKCRKKVTAKKKFTVYKAPNVATFQLKRFDSDRIFGGKVTKFISYPDELDLRPFMSDPTKTPIKYQLNAVLVHVGHSTSSGHYFCFIRNSNNFWYRMDDSNVSLVPQNTVLQQQAYVLFYTRIPTRSEPALPAGRLTTWIGSKSNLDSEDHSQIAHDVEERDQFNEELDRGKTKKLKARSRCERFSNLSKTNPFQRFMSNGYKQDSNKNRFRPMGKHKNRHFKKR